MVNEIVAVISALFVFVITQTILKLVIEPMQEQRKLRGEIAAALTLYANVMRMRDADGRVVEELSPCEEEIKAAENAIRDLASRLRASPWTLPATWLYDLMALVRLVLTRGEIKEAYPQLIGWSNSLDERDFDANERRKRIIREKLRLPEAF